VDLHDVKNVLELHKLEKGEPYYLAMMLVGAYQEVMGNNHNLFGVPNEAHIYIGDDGHIIRKVITGSTLGEMVATVRFDADQLHDTYRRAVMQRIKEGKLSTKEGEKWIAFYESQADSSTYLTPNGAGSK
jgi:arginine decarboxylase